mgnify:CR=1 FL=1
MFFFLLAFAYLQNKPNTFKYAHPTTPKRLKIKVIYFWFINSLFFSVLNTTNLYIPPYIYNMLLMWRISNAIVQQYVR